MSGQLGRIRIAGVKVDMRTGEVSEADHPVRLTPKATATLRALCEANGAPVSKTELIERVWQGAFVTDHVIWQRIHELRHALGDDRHSPAIIETLPKRGYRLIAPISAVPDSTTRTASRTWRQASATIAAAVTAAAVAWSVVRSPGGSMSADDLVAEAEASYAQYTGGRNEVALELYEQAVSLDPANSQALAGLANAYAQKAMYHSTEPWWQSDAERIARQAIALAPNLADGHKALGLALAAQGRLAGAGAAYRRALALDPEHDEALNNLALTERARGHLAEAAVLLERLDRLAPADARTLVNLGATYRLLGLNESARQALEAAGTLPDVGWHPAAAFELSLVDLGEEQLEAARKRLRHAVTSAPVHEGIRLLAGDLELLAGRPAAARAHYGHVLPASRGWDAHAALRWSRVGGDVGQPLPRLLDALASKAGPVAATELAAPAIDLAAVLVAQGKTDEGISWLDTAIDRGYRDRQSLEHGPLFADVMASAGFRTAVDRIDALVAAERAALGAR